MQNLSIPRTAMVTGGTGFMGSHLARLLSASGCEPVLLCRPLAGSSHISNLGRVLYADLLDLDSVRGILRREKPDVLFHLAGTRGRNDDRGAFVACAEVNIDAT